MVDKYLEVWLYSKFDAVGVGLFFHWLACHSSFDFSINLLHNKRIRFKGSMAESKRKAEIKREMDKNNTITLMKYAAFAMVIAALALIEEPTSIPVCNINANRLEKCRSAVTGNNPPPPSDECCVVLQDANLECICRSKSYLPVLASNPSKVHALLSKCDITTIPPACQGKNHKYHRNIGNRFRIWILSKERLTFILLFLLCKV